MDQPKLVQTAVEHIALLPGIGKKTALRLTLHLLRQNKTFCHKLCQSLTHLVDQAQYCQSCHALSDESLCSVCRHPRRKDARQLCIVEDVRDVLAIEGTGEYQGLYHVLGGVIAPMRHIEASDLHIQHLYKRIEQASAQFEEIIFALSATIEGDTTMLYITKQLKDFSLTFSMLARGIPVGTELEYTDPLTLSKSILDRHNYPVKKYAHHV